MTETKTASLDNIINHKNIKTVFQPIISLKDGSIFGHEALSRITCDSAFSNIEILFTSAAEHNRLWDLELLCRTTALEAAFKFMIPPYDKKLFLNVDPNIMHDESFKKGFTKGFLDQYEITPENIIFEITERNIIKDFDSFVNTIDHYKGQNYRIAIDDAGAGYSGLNLISEIRPHYIKLDMKLIRGINSDHLKFAIVKGMVEVSRVSSISLIAEGIETNEELETLVNLGVQYGQGYLIQKPDEVTAEISEALRNTIRHLNQKKNVVSNTSFPQNHIRLLSSYTDTVDPSEKVTSVYNFFNTNKFHFGLCVIKDDLPVGIITPEALSSKLSGQYGYTLNQNKPVSEIMDKNFLKVDHNMSVSDVSALAISRPNNKLYDLIIVTENEKYIGTVTIRDLLQKTTELEITSAKHQNPLTGLPGNLIIHQQLTQCLTDSLTSSFAYIDIDNFKAFNDYYGFEKGDMVLRFLAGILSSTFNNQFVGHIGGDDFIVILDKVQSNEYFDDIEMQFSEGILNFYNDDDIRNGYILIQNRRGMIEKFPLMTITCVVLNNLSQKYEDVYHLTENLSDLKREAKQYKIPS